MKTNRKSMIAVVIALFTLCLVAVSSQATVRIGNGQKSDGDFSVTFSPVKPVVKVGEKIRFRIEGNKKFYLYLFSISEGGEGVMLLPNKLQQYHTYKANSDYIVPEKDVEFVSDKPGVEEIIMVATTKKLKLDRGKYKAAGKFFSAKSEVIEHDVKSLRVRSKKKKAQQVVQVVKLVVTGKTVDSVRIDSTVTPFVACDKNMYQVGEKIAIIYGADKPGFVYLWYVGVEGKAEFLKKEKVDGARFNRVDGVAEAPYGDHTLIAVWDEKGTLKEGQVDLSTVYIAKDGVALVQKGISLTEKPANFATYKLSISK